MPRRTRGAERRIEAGTPEMLQHGEGDHAFEHRNLDFLALAGREAMVESGGNRIGGEEGGRLVRDEHRDVSSLLSAISFQCCEAAGPLDDVVEGGTSSVTTAPPEAPDVAEDDVGLDRPDLVVVEAGPLEGLGAHIVDEDVGVG